jgi:hypothetical protein
MTGRILLILAVLILAFLVVSGGGYTSAPKRKKILLQVETPHGLVEGASVIELRNSRAPWWYPTGTGNRNGLAQRGEAPYVDLGSGRYLFVALNNQINERPIKLYLDERGLDADGSFKPDSVPLLVTYGDITSPSTVRKVEPDGLESVFGPGYRLRSLTATDTSERATRGTLASKFPALHRELQLPPAKRLGTSGEYNRMDIRQLGWNAFEASDW